MSQSEISIDSQVIKQLLSSPSEIETQIIA